MPATYDNVGHHVLLNHLSDCFGIHGPALQGIASYLDERKQFVVVDGVTVQRSSGLSVWARAVRGLQLTCW